jgi:hypothetical protein
LKQIHSFLLTFILIPALASCSSSPKQEAATPQPPTQTAAMAPPLTAEESVLVSVTATVQKIDLTKRELVLKGPSGNIVSFTVDERVQRLNEVKVGDDVVSQYYVSVAGELRPPTEEEKQNPIVMLAQTARAPKGTQPAGGVLNVTRLVTTVEAIDLPTQSLTLKGPLGNTANIRARSMDNLKKIKVGDTIVIIYTEALAVSLEKVAANH